MLKAWENDKNKPLGLHQTSAQQIINRATGNLRMGENYM
jgi:hypothetical protein